MARTIKIALQTTSSPGTTGWNFFYHNSDTQQSLINFDESASGLTWTASSVPLFAQKVDLSGYSGGSKHGIPQEVIQVLGGYVTGAGTYDATLEGSLNAGESISEVRVWGAVSFDDSSDDRRIDWTVGGVTKTHDAQNYGTQAPIVFTSNLSLPLSFSGVATLDFGYVGVFEIDIADSSGLLITSVTDSDTTADQITEGQTADITLDGDTGAQGTGSVELRNAGGTRIAILQVNSWNNGTTTTINVTGVRGALRYGDTDNQVVVIQDDGTEIPATGITFAAPALTTWANGTSADTSSSNSLTQGMGSVPSDYQIAFTDDGTGDPINPVINSDTTVASVENPGSGVAELYDNTDGTWGPEAAYELALDTTATPVPQGTTTIDSVSVTADEATVNISYSDTDQDSFEYRLDGGTAVDVGNNTTFTITGLADGTYSIEVRAVNSGGGGTWSASDSFTVDTGAVSAPSGTITLGTAVTTDNSFSQPYTYDSDDADGFQYRIDGGTWKTAGQPLQVFGLSADTQHSVDLRPFNEGGFGTAASTTITTDAADQASGLDLTKINQPINSNVANAINNTITE